MAFVVVDFVLYLFLIAAFSSLEYQVIFHIGTRAASKILKMLAPVLEVIIALILAFCAFCLAEALKKQTVNKPNVCLLCWHILNIFLLTIILIIYDFYYDRWINATDFFKAWY